MPADPEIVKKVENCLKELEKLKEKGEEIENMIAVASATLEEVCGEEGCFEAAPLSYKLGQLLIDGVRARAENETIEEGMEGLDEDDLEAAWENLEMAKNQYEQADDKKDHRKEISNILMLLQDIDVEKGEYESAVNHCKEALAIREAIFPPRSREIAECLFSLGLAWNSLASTCALESTDEPEKEQQAVDHAKSAVDALKKARERMSMYMLEKAMEEKVIEKKDITEDNYLPLVEELKTKEVSENLQELLSIVEDMETTIQFAEDFSVKQVIEDNKKRVSELYKLMEEMSDEEEEDDGDFEEEEEEEEGDDEDVVIEDVEELKKSVKRAGETLPEEEKKAKKE